jgi:hypothetical protein
VPCPHLARWPRQPDSHSGNAGSNPAGDAGLICRPVVFFGGPRLGGRACQRCIIAVLSVPAAGHRATNSIGEVRLLAERPIHQRRVLTRGALPLFSWHETQASEACCPGSIPGRGAAGRDGPNRGSYPRVCRFNSCSCNPRRLEASGGSHKAVRGGSNPPVAISFSGCGSIWQSTGSGHRGLEVRILPPRPFQQ